MKTIYYDGDDIIVIIVIIIMLSETDKFIRHRAEGTA